MQTQLITPSRAPVRRHDKRDLDRVERECAYRPQGRVEFGSGPSVLGLTGSVSAPDAIYGADLIQWIRADLLTVSTGVSLWNDKASPSNYTQGTAGAQPAFNATGAPNSQPCVTFDAVDDYMDSGIALAAPNVTPTFICAMIRQDTWTTGKVLFGSSVGASRCSIEQRTPTPELIIRSSTVAPGNSALAIGAWGRMEGMFQGTTADWIKLKATLVTGATAGVATSGTGRRIGASSTLTNFGGFSVAEMYMVKRIPTSLELVAGDAYMTSRYGSGLV